jgi:hypothetical protein
VETGYDPARIRGLSVHTRAAVDAIRALRSADPLAADAIRALARQNLEDVWMPAVVAIERSEAMITWRTTGPGAPHGTGWRPLRDGVLPAHRPPPNATPLAGLTNDALLGRLQWADRVLAEPTGTDTGVPDPPPLSSGEVDELAAELAQRVRTDARFADRLAGLARTMPLVGRLLGRAPFPVPFVTRIVTAMMWPQGPQATADLDGYAGSLSAALQALVPHPAACLELLLDPAMLYGITAWERLDAGVVADVVVSGLHRAVAADPARLADGYSVLARLVELADGPLDRGFAPGAARGVAVSLAGYVDTLAPAIGATGDGPVVVSDERLGLSVDLGTYDEVASLLGAVVRDGEASARLGAITAAHADHVLSELGPDVLSLPGLASTVAFTLLVEDAGAAEQAQVVMEAAAEEARRRRLGDAIGFGLSLGLVTSGLGTAARSAVSQIVRVATDVLARVEPDRLPRGSIGAQIHMQITLTTVASAVADPAVLRSSGAAPLTRTEAADLTRRLQAIERCDDTDERARLVSRLEQHIDQRVPRLGGHLDAVRAHGQLDQLR